MTPDDPPMTDSEQASEPEAPPPPPPPPPTLGEQLREARLSQDLTARAALDGAAHRGQAAARARGQPLRADRRARIRQRVISKQYGIAPRRQCVADLLALYYKQTTLADVQIQPSRTITLRDERQITSWVLAVIVLLAIIAGLAVWLWNGGSFGALLPTGGAAAPRRGARDDGGAGVGSRSRSPLEPAPGPEQRPVPLEGAAPAVESATPDATSRPPPRAHDTRSRSLPLRATTWLLMGAADAIGRSGCDCRASARVRVRGWAEITDARGERLLFGLNTAGRNVTVRGEPPFAIVLGNANAVTAHRRRRALPDPEDGPARQPRAFPSTSPRNESCHGRPDPARQGHERRAGEPIALVGQGRVRRGRAVRGLRLSACALARARAHGTLQPLDRRAHGHRLQGDVHVRRPQRQLHVAARRNGRCRARGD